MILLTYANSEGSGEPVHFCSLIRAFAVLSHNIGIYRKLPTESHISDPIEYLCMHIWRISKRTMLRTLLSWDDMICLSDEEEEDTDALLYLPVAPDIDEPEEGWPVGSENVSNALLLWAKHE